MNLLSTVKSTKGLKVATMIMAVVGMAATAISGLMDTEIQKRELEAKVKEKLSEK